LLWFALVRRGKQFALRDRLKQADVIVVLAGTRGNIKFLEVTSPFHQRRTYLTFAKVFQPHGIEIINYYAETGEWHPLIWFLSSEQRKLVKSEMERIKRYREKGDLL
jgi:hypothetical protein